MSHVDEARLHAYLDGELSALGLESPELEEHLTRCTACATQLDEARRVYATAREILSTAAPATPIVPPFEVVLARAAFGNPHAADAQCLDRKPPEHQRFTHLVASQRGRRGALSPSTAVVSVALHALLLGGVVYASMFAPKQADTEAEEMVSFMDIQEQAPEPPKPPEPEPEPPEPEPEAPKPEAPPPVAKGFQELIPPKAPPAEIKQEDANARAVTAADYSGVGEAGGRADGVVGGVKSTDEAPKEDAAPIFTVEETGVKPEIRNLREVQRALERNYPRQYADAGIAGQVTVKFMIDTDGSVPESSVTVLDATNEAFSEAAIKSVSKFRFKPIKYRGEFVRVWATMPITFQPPQ